MFGMRGIRDGIKYSDAPNKVANDRNHIDILEQPIYNTMDDQNGIHFSPHEIDYTEWKESIAIFGDSTSYGQYLNTGDSLHEILSFDRPVNNFAYPAEGNGHIFKKFTNVVTKYGLPWGVIVGYSSPWRIAHTREDDNIVESIGHWSKEYTKDQAGAIQFLSECRKTILGQTYDIKSAMRIMCKDIKYFEWTAFIKNKFFDDVYQLRWKDHASDGVHPGPETMRYLARKIEKEWRDV